MKHVLSLLLICVIVLASQRVEAYPSNNWKHIKSQHFTLSYSEKTKDISTKALKIAEETASIIGDYFGSDISKIAVSIVLKDHQDYSNGNASRYVPLVNIDCRKTDSFFRNDRQWLKKILSHELSHIYTLRIMQLPIFLQLVSTSALEDNENNVFFTYRHNSLPLWFVEGIAQLGSYQCKSDYRDPFREMLLRDAFHNDLLLSLNEMARFEGSSREYELVYNQGFDFILYLIKTYPDISMKTVCHQIRSASINYVFKINYQKTIQALFDDWKKSLKKRFPSKKASIETRQLFNPQNPIFVSEIASVENEKYVIANWRHDYNHFDLFVMSSQKKIQKIIGDSGQVLRSDHGIIFFNKQVYNRETGTVNYDIFSIDGSNKIKQVTRNKRCLAFDVRDRHLIFAAYKNGTTHILLRKPDQSTQKLVSFPAINAVYNISMISKDTAVLSLSKNERKTMAIVTNTQIEYPFENLGADLFDICYAGNNRYFFVSTIDGSPQLYWCDLNADKYRWYQMTTLSGGVRFPQFDRNANRLTCSIFHKGDYRLHAISQPFVADKKIDVSALRMSTPSESTTKEKKIRTSSPKKPFQKDIYSNMVFHTPLFYVLFDSEKENDSSNNFIDISKNIVSPGIKLFAQNAPSNIKLFFNSSLNIPIGYEIESNNYPDINIGFNYDFKQIRFVGEMVINSTIKEYKQKDLNMNVFEKQNNKVNAGAASYQLSKDHFLSFRLENVARSLNQTIQSNHDSSGFKHTVDFETPEIDIYKAWVASFEWKKYSYSHRFDPAGVGNPFFEMRSTTTMYANKYFDNGVLSHELYDLEDRTIFKLGYRLHFRDMYYVNSASFQFILDGFIYMGENEHQKISPFMYEKIGRESSFSGYHYDINACELHRSAFEVKFNPFLTIKNGIQWYERMNCGLKIEAGYLKYFDHDYETTFPASAEISFRYRFFFWPDRKGSAYIKYARPLRTIDGISDTSSYRVYLGLSI